MKGVLYAVEIAMAAIISARGTNIPVLMKSWFIGALISPDDRIVISSCEIIGCKV